MVTVKNRQEEMSNLIITIIAIMLAATLVLATIMWGGNAANDSAKFEIKAENVVSEMNQIRGAIISYQAMNGEWPNDLSDLTPSYLRELPEGWVTDGLKEITSASAAEDSMICERANERLGSGKIAPLCADVSGSFMGCCLAD